MSSSILIQNVLRQGGFFMLNKMLIKILGLVEAATLAVLIDKDVLFGDWFFATAETMEKELNIGRRPYDSAIKNLKEKRVIETIRKGLPAKTYFKINYDYICELLSSSEFVQNEQTNLSKTNITDCPKRTANKEHIYKEQNNKTTNVVKENIIKEVPVIEVEVVDEYSFDTFWKLYDYKKGKALAEKQWNKLTKQERKLAIEYVPAYVASTPDKSYRKHPSTFINQKGWNDEITDRSHQHQPQSKQQSTSMQDIFARADAAYQSGLFS